MLIQSLADLRKTDAPTFGAKAANLGELISHGLLVPPGYAIALGGYDVVTSSCCDRECNCHSAHQFTNLLRTLGVADLCPAAVRSSGLDEDGNAASFAGIHESYLRVPFSDIPWKVELCRESFYSERALAYRKQAGIGHTPHHLSPDCDVAMPHTAEECHGMYEHGHGGGSPPQVCVIIQQMVDAAVAGVMFTVNPVTGADECVIEAVPGLGEALVSGEVTPDQYIWRPNALSLGGYIENTGSELPLSGDDTHALVALGKRAALWVLDGAPADIEWAIGKDGYIYFLQIRPITTTVDCPKARGDGGAHSHEGGYEACTP